MLIHLNHLNHAKSRKSRKSCFFSRPSGLLRSLLHTACTRRTSRIVERRKKERKLNKQRLACLTTDRNSQVPTVALSIYTNTEFYFTDSHFLSALFIFRPFWGSLQSFAAGIKFFLGFASFSSSSCGSTTM